QGVRFERLAQRGQPGLVAEEHADSHLLLAGLAELGPVARDRGVEVELPPRDQDVGAQGNRPLGAGPEQADGVALPRPARAALGDAAPQVRDRLALDDDADRGADLAAFREVARELLLDRPKGGVTGTLDVHGSCRLRVRSSAKPGERGALAP